jgi:hypothetical protein
MDEIVVRRLEGVLVCEPIITRAEDGTLSIDWPEGYPTECLINRTVILELIDQINAGKRLSQRIYDLLA